MTPTLQTFMSHIVDYAGLFPPARLPMEDAAVNYDEYLRGLYLGMLGKFVIPASRLAELHRPWANLSILSAGGEDGDGFLSTLAGDLESIGAFVSRLPDGQLVHAIEAPLPEALVNGGDPQTVAALIARARAMMIKAELPPVAVFYEISFKGDWRRTLAVAARAVSLHNREPKRGFTDYAGVKLRTGGTVASAFPSADQIAAAILACRDAGAPFKCTAGLHHPFRRYDESVQTKMHGFVNVFGGAALAHVHQLDEAALTEILLDEDGHHFLFAEESFAWKNLMISREELEKARREFAISFGSCSFTEPLEDLQQWKLL